MTTTTHACRLTPALRGKAGYRVRMPQERGATGVDVWSTGNHLRFASIRAA